MAAPHVDIRLYCRFSLLQQETISWCNIIEKWHRALLQNSVDSVKEVFNYNCSSITPTPRVDDLLTRDIRFTIFLAPPLRRESIPGDLVTQFGGLGRKILTPYHTTARGLRCSVFPNSLQHFHRQNSTDHSVSTTFPEHSSTPDEL